VMMSCSNLKSRRTRERGGDTRARAEMINR